MRPTLSLLLLCALSAGSLRAQTAGTITGRVSATGDSAVAGATVAVRGFSLNTISDSAGRFLIAGVPVGTRIVTASARGWSAGFVTVTVRSGGTVDVALHLGAPITLQAVVVTAASSPYVALDASVGSKMPVPIRDLPQTINVVSQEVIADQGITTMRQITPNVSSVIPVAGYDGAGLNEQSNIIRGFTSDYTNHALRNGFKDFAGTGPRDVANIERVEFLKGPSSVLYGATGALGGVPNTVTRQPTATSVGSMEFTGDEFGLLRLSADLGGPVDRDTTWRYRFDGALQQVKDFRTVGKGGYGVMLAPSVDWVPNSRTRLSVTLEYTQRTYQADPYMPLDSSTFGRPTNMYYGEPGFPLSNAYGFVAQAVLEYQLNDAWHFREGLSALGGQMHHNGITLSTMLAPDTVMRYSSMTDEGSRDYSSQSEFVYDGGLFGTRNRALMGLELTKEVYTVNYGLDSIAPIALTDPQYGATSFPGPKINAGHPENELGVYAMDIMDLGSEFKAAIGARWDYNKTTEYVNGGGYSGNVATQNTSHISPRAGLVYQPNATLSFYGGWSQSFLPNLSCQVCGDPPTFPPELGVQYELGARAEFFRGRLTITAATYQITKENVLEPDLTDPTGMRSVVSKQQQSKGFELDVAGSPARGWQIIAAYAYTDAHQTKSTDTTVAPDQRLPNVPYNMGSFWVTYAFSTGAVHGLQLGAGVQSRGSRDATFPNSLVLPGDTKLDLMGSYSMRKWRAQLNLFNLTDAKSYDAANMFNWALQPGNPRTVQLTLGYQL